jgi:hypothetical protein
MSDKARDALEEACALVGRFQYYFARIEEKIDHGVIKLLGLDEKAGAIVTGGVDFAKKLNLVRTSAYEQAANKKDQQFADVTCDDVFKVNTTRQSVIHSSFEPAPGGGVQFKRTDARGGRLRVQAQVWDDKKFSESYEEMRRLEADLNKLILLIKPLPPMDWFTALSQPIYARPRVLPTNERVIGPPWPPAGHR